MSIALFDFDGTLCRGDSVVPYLLFAIRKGFAPRRQLLRAAGAWLRQKTHPGTVARAKETTLSFISGRTVAEMDALARDFFREVQRKKCFAAGIAELNRLRSEGTEVLVVSASAEVWMRVLPEFLPVDRVIATPCQVDAQGRYTGHIAVNCRGEEKLRLAAPYLTGEISAAYGDSAGDAPMLRLAKHPVLVNPKPALKKLLPDAEIRHWR